MHQRFTWLGIGLCTSLLSGCIFVGDYEDFYEPAPKSITYEVCYSNIDCFAGEYCEELALPADRYTDYVNAICTVDCRLLRRSRLSGVRVQWLARRVLRPRHPGRTADL
jgi:hypothetical protein